MSFADEAQREPRSPFGWLLGRRPADGPPDPVHWRRDRAAARRSVERSGLFDRSWYLARNPDVARAGVDALDHFLDHGGDEGRNPSAHFDTRAYVAQQPDAAGRRVQPLLHFLRHREERGLVPLPVLDRAVRSVATVPDVMPWARPGRGPANHEPPRWDQTPPQAHHHDMDAIRRALEPLGYRLRTSSQSSPYAVYPMPAPQGDVVVLVVQRDRPAQSHPGWMHDQYGHWNLD